MSNISFGACAICLVFMIIISASSFAAGDTSVGVECLIIAGVNGLSCYLNRPEQL